MLCKRRQAGRLRAAAAAVAGAGGGAAVRDAGAWLGGAPAQMRGAAGRCGAALWLAALAGCGAQRQAGAMLEVTKAAAAAAATGCWGRRVARCCRAGGGRPAPRSARHVWLFEGAVSLGSCTRQLLPSGGRFRRQLFSSACRMHVRNSALPALPCPPPAGDNSFPCVDAFKGSYTYSNSGETWVEVRARALEEGNRAPPCGRRSRAGGEQRQDAAWRLEVGASEGCDNGTRSGGSSACRRQQSAAAAAAAAAVAAACPSWGAAVPQDCPSICAASPEPCACLPGLQVARERVYTPGPDDVGAILKFETTAYDAGRWWVVEGVHAFAFVRSFRTACRHGSAQSRTAVRTVQPRAGANMGTPSSRPPPAHPATPPQVCHPPTPVSALPTLFPCSLALP